MQADQALELMRQLLWNTFLVAGPLLGAALIVGLLVSVFQVATQLQEMTLSYVPKLLAIGFLLVAMGPWMLNRITGFAISMYRLIPGMT